MTRTRAPRVAVVIPVYNRERYLARTIDSVLAQSITDWQLVIADDGSTDSSEAIARRYASDDDRITVASAANGGVAAARNRGFAATDPGAEFVILLDSDDRWFPDTLERMVAALDQHPEWVSVYGLARCIDADDELIPGDDLEHRMRRRREFRDGQLVELDAHEPTTFAGMVHFNFPVTPGLHLIRRTAMVAVGEFDPATDPADDWDFAIRLSRHGPLGFIDGLVLEWRRHDDTLTQTASNWGRVHYRVLANTLNSPENTDEQHAIAVLAYRNSIKTSVRRATEALRTSDWRQAIRNGARSAQSSSHLIASQIVRRFRRRSRSLRRM